MSAEVLVEPITSDDWETAEDGAADSSPTAASSEESWDGPEGRNLGKELRVAFSMGTLRRRWRDVRVSARSTRESSRWPRSAEVIAAWAAKARSCAGVRGRPWRWAEG